MPIMKRMKLLFTLAIPVFLCQNIQAQTSSRLTAESHWVNNGSAYTPMDSTNFSYLSSSRGGDLTHALMFDNSVYGTYDSSMSFAPQVSILQQYNTNNMDSVNTTSQNIAGTWTLTNRTLFTYNSSNLVATMIQQTWNGSSWTPVTENVYSYTGSHQLQVNQHETWNGASFMLDSVKTFYYDASTGLLINEVDNYFSSSLPIYTYEWSYTYDSSTHYLLSKTESFSNSGVITGFAPLNMVQYFYDSSGNMTAMEKEHYDAVSSVFVGDSLHSYSGFNSAHMPHIDLLQYWDPTTSTGGSWVYLMQFTNTYNTYHQLTNSTGISWNITGIWEYAVGDPMNNYFYATYTHSTVSAVKNVANNNGDANIYPVPVQNMMHIDLTWDVAQSAMLSIYDVQGRMVKMWDAPSATTYNTTIGIGDLAGGVYVLKINGQQGQIVKQFVVSH
jgi:hypothetical protein